MVQGFSLDDKAARRADQGPQKTACFQFVGIAAEYVHGSAS